MVAWAGSAWSVGPNFPPSTYHRPGCRRSSPEIEQRQSTLAILERARGRTRVHRPDEGALARSLPPPRRAERPPALRRRARWRQAHPARGPMPSGATVARRPRVRARTRRQMQTITANVPGGQYPVYFCRRRMLEIVPSVRLALNVVLGIPICSDDGNISFGMARASSG